jgi:hypothetical protein
MSIHYKIQPITYRKIATKRNLNKIFKKNSKVSVQNFGVFFLIEKNFSELTKCFKIKSLLFSS